MRRLRTVLNVSATLLLITGGVLSLMPPGADLTAASPEAMPQPIPDSLRTTASAAVDSLAVEIVVANIFGASRTAPLRRYSPPELAEDSAAGMIPDPAMSDSAALAAGFTAQLFGTIVGGDSAPGASRALLQLDALDPVPRLYGVGERAGGYRVVSISRREVVLYGPTGRLVLRLPEREEHQ